MAEIIVKYNTVDKSCTITQDGETVDNCKQASFYCQGEMKGEEVYGMQLDMYESDEENDTRHRYSMYAKEYAKKNIQDKIRDYWKRLEDSKQEKIEQVAKNK